MSHVANQPKYGMPGSAYIHKILEFNEKHVESGQLYAEFLKGSFKEKDGSLCKHCCVGVTNAK